MASAISPLLRVVSCNPNALDPALDAEVMGKAPEGGGDAPIIAYLKTRDPALLVLREGMTPVYFVLRRLPLAFLTDVLDGVFGSSAQRRLAFRAACHRVELSPTEVLEVTRAGEKGEWIASKNDNGVTLAPESWAQEIADRLGGDVVMEMGSIAIAHSRLPRGARGPFGWWGGSAASP